MKTKKFIVILNISGLISDHVKTEHFVRFSDGGAATFSEKREDAKRMTLNQAVNVLKTLIKNEIGAFSEEFAIKEVSE